MIRESLYFSFDGVKSTNYPIANVSVGEGAFSESVASRKTINENYPRNAFKPYFFGTQKTPKEFPLTFAFLEPWNDLLMDEIVRWLNVDDYKPLFFEADLDKVFYVMPIDDITSIHNGLKQGYLTLNVRCDSAYSYSHYVNTPDYNMLERDSNIVEIINYGHIPMLPEMWIEKISSGDIVINNKTNGNQEMRFENIEDGERLHVDCMEEIIDTNKENTHRYDDFNDEYLEIVYGKNIIQVSRNVIIRFRYQHIFS